MRVPRKVDGILGFFTAFETLISDWPADEKRPLTDISERIGFNLPQIVEYLSDVIDKAGDVHEPISRKEADKGLLLLKQRKRADIEAHERREQKAREKVIAAFDATMDKVRKLQSGQNWYSAYRTLSYFAGVNASYLSSDTMLNICNDCLRLGIKSEVNFQELGRWLNKGIEISLQTGTPDSFEDALDFIDAYGDYFLADARDRGEAFLNRILGGLNRPAINLGKLDRLDAVAQELKLPKASLQL